MKWLFFSFLPLIILIIGCTEDNVVEITTNSDSELKAKLVGTWSTDYLSITYDSESNFQETIDYVYNDTTIHHAEIIAGTYDINNGILMYKVTNWNINYPSSNERPQELPDRIQVYKLYAGETVPDLNKGFLISSSIPDFKIQIENDLLYFYPVDILTGVDSNTTSLWGKWKTFQWTNAYNTENQDYILGELEWEYNFNQHSMNVNYGAKFSVDSSTVIGYQTKSITYDPPNLSWGEYSKYTIEFHDGQIYMFYKLSHSPIPLKKEN